MNNLIWLEDMENGTKDGLIKEALTKQIDKIYPSREALEAVLKSAKKLTIYWGVDPTAPDMHLGHSTNFFVLRRFQKLGHKVVILMGDYTAQIGDPTGKDKKRKVLTEREVKENLKTYQSQVLKILDPKKTIFKFNSEWWNKMSAKELLALDDLFTQQQMVERDMFQRRIKEDKPVSIKEFQYPLLQGYDSVALKTDIELGATDQLFNMLVGRTLVKTFLKKEKFIITTPLLINPESGDKLMSKSEGNYVSLNDSPSQMYGKTMALPDGVILQGFRFCTDINDEVIGKIKKRLATGENPRNLKAELAFEIVKIYHGEKSAKGAEEEFNKVFRKHELPGKMPVAILKKGSYDAIDLLLKLNLVKSKSEARRLVNENAVKINSGIVKDSKIKINAASGLVVQIGKKRFVKIGIK